MNKIKVLQKELEESNIKDSELNELNNKYLKEKQIMEQEMNKKEQLQDNNIKISNLKKSKNLLIKGLNKHEKINELKTKENDELKNEIRKLKKLNEQFTGLPTILQDVKKQTIKLELLFHLIIRQSQQKL